MISKSVVFSILVCIVLSLWAYSVNNCCNDPILNRNISEIIRSWPGFTAEEHYLTTEDGYEVLVERSYSKITQETPIIIVHGIAMNALGWVNRGNVSLARLLGDLGYDVWMLNFRGTTYSKGHVELKTTNSDYWKYNVHDLGIYDVRQTVKYVNKKTTRQSIYIGYSMGTTSFFIYSSTFPDEAKNYLRGMIAVAPVINYKDVKSIIEYSVFWWPYLKSMVYVLWSGEILPGYSVLMKPLVMTKQGMYLVQYFVNLMFGDDYEQMDPLNYPQFLTQMLDTAGAEVYTHFVQLYQSGVFQNFDYGELKNLEIYGTTNPPPYDLSKVPVPISIFQGANDFLATPTNAKQIYSEIQPSLRCGYQVVPFEKWSHIDFLNAKDLPKYFYKYLFIKIKDMESGKCAV
ncbi:hypothetical protein JTB14_019589 [Gonioctena quinquepunctata]|nr:hypothetical protein JTB14_019589 [Gonioctena quinquepunctata]